MHCRFHLRHGHDLPLTLGKGKRKGAQVHAIFRSEESALELPLRLTKAEDNPWASKKTNHNRDIQSARCISFEIWACDSECFLCCFDLPKSLGGVRNFSYCSVTSYLGFNVEEYNPRKRTRTYENSRRNCRRPKRSMEYTAFFKFARRLTGLFSIFQLESAKQKVCNERQTDYHFWRTTVELPNSRYENTGSNSNPPAWSR